MALEELVSAKDEELNSLYAKEEERLIISKENEGSPSSSPLSVLVQ